MRPVSLGTASGAPLAVRPRLQPLLVPAVCHHCRQPDCLTGCPVNAIKLLPAGRVAIDDQTCIGCGDCAALCPYEAITLIPRPGSPESAQAARAAGETESAALAVKCDLCVGAACNADARQPHVHGCEENCPTGALRRLVPDEQLAELRTIKAARLERVYQKRSGEKWRLIEHWHAHPAIGWLHLGGALGIFLLLLLVFARPVFRAGIWSDTGLGLDKRAARHCGIAGLRRLCVAQTRAINPPGSLTLLAVGT